VSEVDYEKIEASLTGSDDQEKLAALTTLHEIPAEEFDKSKLPRFFRLLRARIHDGSREVQYKARGTLDRLKDLTGLGDLALVLTEFLEDEDKEAEPERPELVYGTIPYWLYELSSRDFRIRVKAVMELAQTKQRRIYEKLIELQDREEHEWVHATFAKYLGQFDEPETFERMVRYLDASDNRVRANCLEGLEILGDARAVELVRPLLKDADNRVRANSAKFLVKFDLSSVKSALDEMLASDQEWMRDSATYILARIEFDGIEDYLARALLDENPLIASKAARALARKGNPERARAKLEDVDLGRDERLRRAVTEALEILS
jgi:HEAT repeat protein